MSIIVTGAAGFIGSNLVKALNRRGERDIIAVDDLTDGDKCRNLADCDSLITSTSVNSYSALRPINWAKCVPCCIRAPVPVR